MHVHHGRLEEDGWVRGGEGGGREGGEGRGRRKGRDRKLGWESCERG